MMATCHDHGREATGRCFTCHKPTCPACKTRDGCCSDSCYSSKVRFGVGPSEKLRRPWALPSPFRLLMAAGALFGLWTFRHQLLAWVREVIGRW